MTDDHDSHDTELMYRIAGGDKVAFGCLLTRHLARAVRTAWRIVGSEAAAEDIAQDAFIRVWLRAGTWKPPESGGAKFTTWFHRIIVNLCIDQTRKKSGIPLDNIAEPETEWDDGYDSVHHQDQARAVARALDGLPERQRAAIVLCFYEGHSNKEAADMMGIGVKALESLLVRGRKALREELAPYKSELLDKAL